MQRVRMAFDAIPKIVEAVADRVWAVDLYREASHYKRCNNYIFPVMAQTLIGYVEQLVM